MGKALALMLFVFAGFQGLPQVKNPFAFYHDAKLGFTFNYPTEFIAHDIPHQAQSGEAACEQTALDAMRHVTERQIEAIHIERIAFDCVGKTADTATLKLLTDALAKQVLSRVGPPTLLAPVSYRLNGYEAEFTQASAPDASDGIPGYSGVACVLMKNDVVCWAVLTAYPSHLASLFANTIRFGDGPSMPLVAAGVVVNPPAKDPK